MYQTIQIQPLLGGVFAINRNNGRQMGPILSIICIMTTLQLGQIAIFEVGVYESAIIQKQGNWYDGIFQVEWSFQFDVQSVSMFIPVMQISVQVQMYSQSYMSEDPHISRFFSYLSQFSFFMQIQITGENLLLLFVGWEGVGLISYLLVNYWTTRIAANQSSQKAFQVNRIGDMFQSQGLQLVIGVLGDLSFSTIFSTSRYINADILFLIVLTIIVGASAKSGQIGLHTWQPSAMEGPTPVSAQQHSATMVTAGVYQQMRFSPQLEYSTTGLLIITWIGSISAQQGAACGLQENDLKRIIAFSTTSQQGYMIMSCGISQYNVALFHQINHAMFKALLFQAAGSVIHAINDVQDVRKMGGLSILQPQTYGVILQANLSQMAFPFFTGFYSKDFILELALIPKNMTYTIGYIQILIAAILTATYSSRQLIMTFISKPNFPRTSLNIIMDPEPLMLIPLIILAQGSVVFGYICHELFLGQGSTYYQHVLFTHPNHFSLLDASLSPASILKYLPPMTQLIQISILPYISGSIRDEGRTVRDQVIMNIPVSSTLNHFNIFNHWIITNIFRASGTVTNVFDKGLIEIMGPLGQVRIIHYVSYLVEITFSSGYISNYAQIIAISLIAIGGSILLPIGLLPYGYHLATIIILIIITV